MSKAEKIWNWFIGIFLTLGNLALIIIYAITEKYNSFQIVMTIVWLNYGIFKIAEMIVKEREDE